MILVLVGGCTSSDSDTENSASVAQWPERPNIVWISVEDIGPRLGAYGDSVTAPTLDRLAEQGMRFTNAFTTAGVCAPQPCGHHHRGCISPRSAPITCGRWTLSWRRNDNVTSQLHTPVLNVSTAAST